MNKKILALLVVLTMTALLAISVFAADLTEVYVKSGATGTGASTEDPIGDFADAVDALGGNGGTIWLCDPIFYYQDLTIPEQANDLTIKAVEGTSGALVLSRKTLTLEKNSNANTVKFDMPLVTGEDGITIFGAFNSVHFGKNFTVDGILDFYGGVAAAKSPSNTYNGYVAQKTTLNRNCTTELPYTITVDNGDFRVFTGGNYRAEKTSATMIGAIAAKIDIIIDGGSFNSTVSYGVNDPLKLDTAFSISGMSMLAGDATLTINGGDFNTPIYAQGYLGLTSTTSSAGSRLVVTDKKYYAADGDITITVNGGDLTDCIEINAEQVAASYNRLLRGNYTLAIGEDAILADGIVLDATQVKAYPDENGNTPAGSPVATLTYPADKNVTVKRFDVVNDVEQTYDEPLRIACIGDSITQGSRAYVTDPDGTRWEDFATGSYPAQLYTKAAALGHDVIISNYGCGATKVMDRGGLWYNAGLAYTLSQEETDADYFVIGLGTNDAANSGSAVGFADTFYDMYTDFIQSYADLPCTDMVYGTTAIYRNGSDLSAVALTRAMQMQVLTELAEAGEKATLVDLYGLTLEDGLDGDLLWSGDNLHPDVPGYKIYADAIYNAVLAADPLTVPENFYMKEVYVASTANGGKKTGVGTLADPTSELSVALAKADPEGATIYIIGAYDFTKLDTNTPFNTPRNIKKLTIAGYGEGASLSVNTKMFYINGDVKFDNIQLSYSNKTDSAIYIACGYRNAEFTETFTTTGAGGAVLAAGYLTYGDVFTNTFYTPEESISTDRNCTITINGGSYGYIIGGNLHWPGNTGAMYGTYSGDLTLNIGKGVTIKANKQNGVNGMNYLTGKVTANLASWSGDASIREYSVIGTDSVHMAEYDATKNTGTITVNLLDGLNKPILKARDINKDGNVDFADALLILKYAIGGTDVAYDNDTYFDQTSFKMTDVLYALKKAVQ